MKYQVYRRYLRAGPKQYNSFNNPHHARNCLAWLRSLGYDAWIEIN